MVRNLHHDPASAGGIPIPVQDDLAGHSDFGRCCTDGNSLENRFDLEFYRCICDTPTFWPTVGFLGSMDSHPAGDLYGADGNPDFGDIYLECNRIVPLAAADRNPDSDDLRMDGNPECDFDYSLDNPFGGVVYLDGY